MKCTHTYPGSNGEIGDGLATNNVSQVHVVNRDLEPMRRLSWPRRNEPKVKKTSDNNNAHRIQNIKYIIKTEANNK